ncbi:MAG TPA: dihydrofolate reductase family protein [Methanomassiliicoccales archaeon]|nr:dihydrofolate reductase family protein [Methanomassiliicoccales archaeon]
MRPRVVVYNAVSVDGRITGFEADLEEYYGVAMEWPTDVVLIGSNTLLLSDHGFGKEDRPPRSRKKKEGVLAVIPDSHGRVKNIKMLRDVPYWGEVIILCSRFTPKEHLEYLEKRKVEYLVCGEKHVDMKVALEWLAAEHGVRNVRADSGGTLNGVLFENDLVDEVHIMVHPEVVGGTTHGSMFRAGNDMDGKIRLDLKKVERKKDLVLLSYEVKR